VAISFYLASLVIEKFNMDAKQKSDVFTGVYIMFVGAIGSGVSVSQMPSKSKAEKSANKVFSIIDEPSKIDPRIKGVGRNMKVETGTVTFENVNFKYPSRN
jgi:ABC-type multidrug transport system fused ATPase/permease subunit